MERYTLAWDQKRRDPSAVPIAAYILDTDMGSRVWTQGVIPIAILGSIGTEWDAEIEFDAEVYFNGGASLMNLEPRVLNFSTLTQRMLPVGYDLFAGSGEAERAGFSVTLANEDALLSQMLAEEYVLNKIGRLLLGYVGLDICDYVLKYRGRVVRWTLSGNRQLTIEHLEP